MRTDRTLLRRYVKLRWHRCLLVEAMRVVAFRNMDHLYVSRVALGVSDWADRDGSDRVFDKMLLNQGMEQNEANRWVLGWASRASWEVYMCLLYAGIEHYRRVTRDHPETRFRPLEEWLDRHNELVEHLRAIRHKLLHPLSEANYLDGLSGIGAAAKRAAPDVFLAIEQLQNQLDDFLEYFRDCLHKSLGDEIAELPGNEMIAHFRARTEKLASSADASTSTRVQTAMRRSVEQLEAMERSLGMEPGSGLALTEAQMQRVRRLDKAVNELDLPLPKRPYRKSRESVQTPVAPQLSGWVLAASFGGQVARLESRFPSRVLRNRGGLLELLVRSVAVFNETLVALESHFRAVFPDLAIEEIAQDEDLWQEASRRSMPGESGAELEEVMVEAAPFRVALGLLVEPLRVYRQLTRQQPELVRQEIDGDKLNEALRVFGGVRNTVFHVPDGQADFFEADRAMAHAPISHGDYLNMVAGLVQFFQGTELRAGQPGQ